jgi:hypothetical protein
MTLSGLAEMYRLLLLIGATDTRAVIAWADSVIATADSPPRWILDISLSTDDGLDSIAEKLREIATEDERTIATYSAILRVLAIYHASVIDPYQTASMLHRLSDHARLPEEEYYYLRSASYAAEEVEDGFVTHGDVLDAIDHVNAYFSARAQASGAKSA